jgi:5S rRNA maturation endonuclease (ribonuclease M5)
MDILTVLNNIGYTSFTEVGGILRCRPLYRDSSSDTVLCINKANGLWFDHSLREGGGLSKLIQKTLATDDPAIIKGHLGDLSIVNYDRESTELTQTKVFDKEILVKLIHDNSYWNSRGISNFTLDDFEGGLAQKGRMIGRYVFPIFNDKDDLVGFAGRQIKDNPDFCKWKILGKKSEWIYPLLSTKYIQAKNEVILVESLGDCLNLFEFGYKNVIVSFGVSLSSKIIEHLLKLDVSKIIIALNNDEDGGFVGNQASEEFQVELCKYFDKEQVKISLPPAKDFGEIKDPEIIKQWYESAKS